MGGQDFQVAIPVPLDGPQFGLQDDARLIAGTGFQAFVWTLTEDRAKAAFTMAAFR